MVDRGACPSFHAAVELIGRRWNGVIIDRLLAHPLRFSELRTAIPDVTPAMLSQRLKELEVAQVVRRDVSSERPIEVSYALTETGQQLSEVLDAVAVWSLEWSGENVRGTAPSGEPATAQEKA
ncbi:winged helix-turn-helix transcriptional regulator [Subtercola lobariae]|uniref:HTH-type transcriptional regulator YvaP n=1 Tax=Subtercola lobariae TaxID=1588641 RepID=A0A917B8W9_9MICO|nr:helix-turn-helix domain-containing protein [Subtercola lobariae]GGF30515.1 putative HTH-type transcriptional regulator YvaP [Subtercola lobariae]